MNYYKNVTFYKIEKFGIENFLNMFWIRIQIPESIETNARNTSLLNPSKGEHTVYRNNILNIFTINGVLRNASYIIL